MGFLFPISNKQLWHCLCCSAQPCVGSGVSCHRKAQRNSNIFHYIPLYIHYHSSSSLSPGCGENVTCFLLVQLKPALPTLNNNIPGLFSMLHRLEPNKPQHFLKRKLFVKNLGWERCLQNPHLMLPRGPSPICPSVCAVCRQLCSWPDLYPGYRSTMDFD